jgi:hypothetical protein
MRQIASPHLRLIRDLLPKYQSKTAADFEAFESALIRANEIYNNTPAEVTLRAFLRMDPENYGEDIRSSLFGLVGEEISYLDAIRTVCGLKLNELVAGILEGFKHQRFRISVLSCRTLFEEAAAAKYYCDKATMAVSALLQIPPSTFRLSRLQRMANDHERSKTLFETISLPNTILKKWYHVRKIDWRKTDFFQDYKLDQANELYPGFFLSALKTLKWQNGIPSSYFYVSVRQLIPTYCRTLYTLMTLRAAAAATTWCM